MSRVHRAVEIARNKGLTELFNQAAHHIYKPIKEKVIRKKVRSQGNIVTHRGIDLYLDPDLISDTVMRRIWTGSYERLEAEQVDAHLDRDTDVLELGAGIGFLSCYISDHISHGTQQIAVEGLEATISAAEINRSLNDAEFELVHAAYNPTDEITSLAIGEEVSGSSVYRDGTSVEMVVSVTIEDLCERFDLDDFQLVCDIEGSEYDLLEHELDILAQQCHTIIIEWHKEVGVYSTSQENLESSLNKYGFERLDAKNNVMTYENRSY